MHVCRISPDHPGVPGDHLHEDDPDRGTHHGHVACGSRGDSPQTMPIGPSGFRSQPMKRVRKHGVERSRRRGDS